MSYIAETDAPANTKDNLYKESFGQWENFECKSEKLVFGMPLWHIGKNAKGVFAVGLKAQGIVSIGVFFIGIISSGFCSVGLLGLGLFTLGIFAAGCFALGGLVCGAIAVGIIACGAVAIGEFALGALAIGHYFAAGDCAYGMFAFGKTKAVGEVFEQLGELTESGKQMAVRAMKQEIPKFYQWVVKIVEKLL